MRQRNLRFSDEVSKREHLAWDCLVLKALSVGPDCFPKYLFVAIGHRLHVDHNMKSLLLVIAAGNPLRAGGTVCVACVSR